MTIHTPLKAALLALLASTALGVLTPQSAVAADVAFKADPKAPEAAIVTSVYASFLKSYPDTKLETAVVDLDGDKVGEIVVRFNGKATCTEARGCHTTVLAHRSGRWTEMFSHSSKTLAVGAPSRSPGMMADLTLNGVQTWRSSGPGTYLPLIESVAKPLDLNREPDRIQAEAINKALRDPIDVARKSGHKPLIGLAQVDLGGGTGKDFIASVEAPSVCGAVGCPLMAATWDGKGYRTVLTTVGVGAVGVTAAKTNGQNDIVVADLEGYGIYRWNGRAYAAAETSYSSKLTPAP